MAMPMFDDFSYDIPTCPPLRIAPLQDPFPAPSSASTRPSPLEPNAHVNFDNEANKLTGRRKALAQAKSLDDFDSNEWGTDTIKPNVVLELQEVDDLSGPPQKKQKLYDQEQIADFVQLPRPPTKAKEDRPRPFRPVSVLNQLHEPPPSAALFPPITPSASQEEHNSIAHNGQDSKALTEKAQQPIRKKKAKDRLRSSSPVMRTYNRGRTKWTEEEIEQLVKGVTIYGTGRWKNILEHPGLHFNECRTPTDLKDRFRVCFPPDKPHKWARPKPDRFKDPDVLVVSNKASQNEKQSKKRARKRHWTDKEDEELKKGFHRYGYDWARMVKDPDLHFDNRSSGQVRDRFRLKFKEVYANEAVARTPKTATIRAKAQANEPSEKETERPSEFIAERKDDDGAAQDMTATKSLAPSLSSGLLNGDDEDIRLSNSILHTGLYLADENVTLAPVMWEDLAQKPLFSFH